MKQFRFTYDLERGSRDSMILDCNSIEEAYEEAWMICENRGYRFIAVAEILDKE